MGKNVDLTQDLGKLSTRVGLVALYNECLDELKDTTEKRVKKFETRTAALRRIGMLFARIKKQRKTPAKARAKAEVADGAVLPCREGGRKAALIDVLSRPKGATMDEVLGVLAAGGWVSTQKRARVAFGSSLRKKGYTVRGEVVDGAERFFLVLPSGKSVPPHIPRKG